MSEITIEIADELAMRLAAMRVPKRDLTQVISQAITEFLGIGKRGDEAVAVRGEGSAKPREGLAAMVGRWDDGDELADAVDRVVAERSTAAPRSIPDFEP